MRADSSDSTDSQHGGLTTSWEAMGVLVEGVVFKLPQRA